MREMRGTGSISNLLHTTTCMSFLIILTMIFSLRFMAESLRFVRKADAGCTAAGSPVVFNFGDSNSDTGGIMAAFGFPIPLPEGRVFFKRSTGRLCDGRLIIDFLCESLNTHFLSPYMEALGANFSNGVNFAICGSKTLPKNEPFALYVQTQQFLHFRTRTSYLMSQGMNGLLSEEQFRNALYMIDIGQNDISGAFQEANGNYNHVLSRIPPIVAEIKDAIKLLYESGGRKFWVHNSGPLGCVPQKVAIPRNDNTDVDAAGCLISHNNGVSEFNSQLSTLVDSLGAELKDATIVYVDIYSIKYDLIANYSKHGFENPLMACCGHGGPPHNYNPKISCMAMGFTLCEDGSKFISWDGVHYTEAANSFVASKILTGEYSRPKISFDFFCKG
ncbi:hypothetical protein LUZ60_011545 [Juncus effusus]|nr:hypothetical protein LUZ60_011545 [Juncus effusus]